MPRYAAAGGVAEEACVRYECRLSETSDSRSVRAIGIRGKFSEAQEQVKHPIQFFGLPAGSNETSQMHDGLRDGGALKASSVIACTLIIEA